MSRSANSSHSNSLHANVRVKVEPGDSSSSISPSESRASLGSIKMEPGLPTTTQRLTSFRLPRDLTLGGNVKIERPKKVYTPNLNAQRNKKKDEASLFKAEPTKPRDNGLMDRGKERGKIDRGRKGNLIQSFGIWSEGMSTPTIKKKNSSSRDSSTESRKYSTNSKSNTKKIVNKVEEKEKLKNLLGDDLDDDDNDADIDGNFLTLPLVEEGKLYEKETKGEANTHSDEDISDNKPIISENGEVISVKKEEKKIDRSDNKELINRISQITENKSNSYILMQLPNLLSFDFNKEDVKAEQPNNSKPIARCENDDSANIGQYILNSLKSGFLGKLEILKSGKARLRLGENTLDVQIGSHSTFRQNLLAAKVDTQSLVGDLVNLGAVSDTLVCSLQQ